MDREAQKVLILLLLVAALIGGGLGMWSWFETGNLTGRGLAVASLVVFAPLYYVFERRFNHDSR